MRHLVRLDGATLVGEASAGDLRFTLPGLLFASPKGPSTPSDLPAGSVRIEEGAPSGVMRRAIRLSQGPLSLDLTFPVASPEVSGGDEPLTEMAPRVVGARTPLSPRAAKHLKDGAFDLVVWLNARSAWTDSERFVRDAIGLREGAGPAPLLWAPRVATPGRLSILYALGLDLLDTTEGLFAAAAGHRPGADIDDLVTAPPSPPSEGSLRRSVEEEYLAEFGRVLLFARAGRLRELVEARLTPEPKRAEVLRYFDGLGAAFQEVHAPVLGSGTRPYSTKEALRRPEVERFRTRFLSRYRPPASKRTLLLVPCSMTKPYASSPSHRRIARALEGIPGAGSLHWASVTSPLGLVPRELECVHPARNYDIPVTGHWDEDERRWVHDAIAHLLASGTYTHTVVHLPCQEYRWLEDLLPPERCPWTVEGESTTSAPSLARLASALRLAHDPARRGPSGGPLARVREELASLARFQFGAPMAERLFEGEVRLMGRPWFQRLISPAKEDLATWREEVGFWRLTVPGARKVLDQAQGSRVQVRGGVELRGDLFAPGVLEADAGLRVGDDVVLLRDGEVLGVGEAKVPGPWMGRLPRGLVVKVRHRSHDGERSRSTASVDPSTVEARGTLD